MRRVGGFLSLAAAGVGVGEEPIPVERDFVVHHWRKEHGLPDNRVLSLLNSRDGHLWAGTRAGVVRFDGHRFQVWSRSTHGSFTNDTCRVLAEDRSGRLWVGTEAGLFSLGEEIVQQNLQPQPGDDRRFTAAWGRNVRALLVPRHGPPLAGTERGLCIQEASGGWPTIGEFQGDPYPAVCSLGESPDGSLWVGLESQLFRRRSGQAEWEPQFAVPGDFETQCVHTITVSPDGTLYILMGSRAEGLGHLYRLGATGWEQLSKDPVNANGMLLAADSAGAVWFSEADQHLGRWQDGQHTSYSLAGLLGTSQPLCLATDRDRNLWVGTTLGGLVCLQQRRIEYFTRREGLPDDNTWTLLEATDGAFWMGTDAGVVRVKDGEVRTFNRETGLASDRIRALAEDERGRIWIGTGAGLHRWDGQRLDSLRFEGDWFRTKIRTLFRARDGAMWVGTAQGLHCLRDEQRQSWFPEDGLPAEDVRVIIEDRHGAIWLGMEGGGVARMTEEGFERFGQAEGLSSSRVWAMVEDEDGRLWIGTDRGLNCLQDGRITALTTAHGLPDNLVNGLVEDRHGYFWVGHDVGIYRVRRTDLLEVVAGRRTTVRAIAYDDDDGLLNLETNGQISQPPVLRRRDGRIAFATVAGVATFDPDHPPDVTHGPPVRIESLVAGGVTLFSGAPGSIAGGNGTPATRIAPGAGRQIEVGFTAPSFRSAGKIRFEYRLLGLDDSWVDAGRVRSASFAHLKPGGYTFEVKAASAHGYWNPEPARVSFRIEPRLFERAGVRYGTGLLGFALLGLIVNWRWRELRRISRLENEAGLNRERHRLARDLHDGLGANLTEIRLLSDPVDRERLPPEAASARFEVLSRRTAEAMKSLRELIWMTNPQADHLEALAGRICDQSEQILSAAAIRCRCEVPKDFPGLPLGPGFRRDVLFAVQEALNNAVRHARAQEVRVRLALPTPRQLQIEIIDDGVGFEVSELPSAGKAKDRGLGLASMRQRIEGLGGQCVWNREPGRGTRLTFTLPLPES